MQCCALGYGAAGSEIHVGHVHCHCTVFYVVCWRHFLGSPTFEPYNRRHTGDNDPSFTQAWIMGKIWTGLALGIAAR